MKLLKPFLFLWKNKFLIYKSVFDIIKKKNSGSILGNGWIILSPIIFMSIYSAIYLVIFNVRPIGMDRYLYVLYIFSGIMSFLFHSEANKDLLKNPIFPIEIIPFNNVLSSLPNYFFGIILIIIVSILTNNFSLISLTFPLFLMLQLLFISGIVWVFSLIMLIIKDLKNVIAYSNMMLMVLSPIAYTPSMVPESFQFLIWLNPLSYFVISNQYIFTKASFPPLNILIAVFIISFFSFFIGYFVFKKLKFEASNYV